MYGSSLIAGAVPDSLVEIQGVYCSKKAFISTYPVIRTYDRKTGKMFIPLENELPCNDGTFIKINGQVLRKTHKYRKINKTVKYNFLKTASFDILINTEDITNKVNTEYHTIKGKLQTKITPDKSKLKLPEQPHWDIWYDSGKNNFIFFCHLYDLMYAAAIEFIVNTNSLKITAVYAREWFKGEF